MDSDDPSKPKASYDPGWNDPPIFSYDATKSSGQPGKRGTLLNKRVAFPLSSSPGGNSPTLLPATVSDTPLPPPISPPCTLPPGSLLKDAKDSSQTLTKPPISSAVPCDCHEAVENGVNILFKLLDSLPADDKREKDDIRKRLDILSKMCNEDKLNNDIYGRIVQLANALHSGDTATASHIQAGLMVDHVGLCSSWMSGVRLLVRRMSDPDV